MLLQEAVGRGHGIEIVRVAAGHGAPEGRRALTHRDQGQRNDRPVADPAPTGSNREHSSHREQEQDRRNCARVGKVSDRPSGTRLGQRILEDQQREERCDPEHHDRPAEPGPKEYEGRMSSRRCGSINSGRKPVAVVIGLVRSLLRVPWVVVAIAHEAQQPLEAESCQRRNEEAEQRADPVDVVVGEDRELLGQGQQWAAHPTQDHHHHNRYAEESDDTVLDTPDMASARQDRHNAQHNRADADEGKVLDRTCPAVGNAIDTQSLGVRNHRRDQARER